jgi:hypothetical protein
MSNQVRTLFASEHASTKDTTAARQFGAGVLDARGLATLVVATPSTAPELWVEYLDGARASYAKHGVSAALEYDSVVEGECTTLFYAALDHSGSVIGGVRAQGPYIDPHQSHALLEWAGQPGLEDVISAIQTRLGDGVVEMKTAWAAEGPAAGSVAGLLARVALPTITMTGARFIMATAADHVLRRWESSGGRVSEDIPPSPYPDSRYRTSLMLWDRDRIAVDADPVVYAQMTQDTGILLKAWQRQTSPSMAVA